MLDASVLLDALHQGRIVICNDKEKRAIKERKRPALRTEPGRGPLAAACDEQPSLLCGPQTLLLTLHGSASSISNGKIDTHKSTPVKKH